MVRNWKNCGEMNGGYLFRHHQLLRTMIYVPTISRRLRSDGGRSPSGESERFRNELAQIDWHEPNRQPFNKIKK